MEYKRAAPEVPGIVVVKGKVSIMDSTEQEIGVRLYQAEYQWDREKRIFQEKSVQAGKPEPASGQS